MMGERQLDQGSLFYRFSLERHVPADHLLRAIDRFARAFFRDSATRVQHPATMATMPFIVVASWRAILPP
jgi:hypothetical protein